MMTLEEEIMVSLVWTLPKNTTITVGQIKELAPVLTQIVEQKKGNKNDGSSNSYERIRKLILDDIPEVSKEASKECHSNNCQSMPTILITTIEKLTGNVDRIYKES